MADVLIIHRGVSPSPKMQDRIEREGNPSVGTASLGPEATYTDEHPDLVVADDPDVAAFWREQEVEVDEVGEESSAPAEQQATQPQVGYEYSKNGFWRVYEQVEGEMEQVDSGRGREALAEALSERKGEKVDPKSIEVTD